MNRLLKFLSISSQQKLLLIQTWLLMLLIRILMYFVPFEALKKLVGGVSEKSARSRLKLDSLIWAVDVAKRYVPLSTCLCQALTMSVLLRRNSYPSKLVLGVAKENGAKFEAHAWVESGGRVVVGGTELSRFTVLSSF